MTVPDKGGRPFLGPSKVISMRVPLETANIIERRAKNAGLTVNMYLVEIVIRNEITRSHHKRRR